MKNKILIIILIAMACVIAYQQIEINALREHQAEADGRADVLQRGTLAVSHRNYELWKTVSQPSNINAEVSR